MPYELPQNRVAAAGGVSGSVKPLPPFAPNPLAIAYRERYKALVVAAAKAYGGSTRFFLACGPMSSDYCSEVEWVINQTNAVGIKSYLLNQVCLLVPSVSSCPRGSTAPFLRPALLPTGVHRSLPPPRPSTHGGPPLPSSAPPILPPLYWTSRTRTRRLCDAR